MELITGHPLPDNDTLFESIHILGHPSFKEDPAYLGHYINDRFSWNSEQMTSDNYLALSSSRANVALKPCIGNRHAMIVALKDLEVDQECFMTYGVDYWTKNPLVQKQIFVCPQPGLSSVPSNADKTDLKKLRLDSYLTGKPIMAKTKQTKMRKDNRLDNKKKE
jgi:hypothetical protein